MTTKKVTRKPAPKSLFERLDDSVFGAPIRIANRTFLAGLGVIATIQDELGTAQTEWDKRFKKLVKEGEKTRDRIEHDFADFRKDVEDQFTSVRERVFGR